MNLRRFTSIFTLAAIALMLLPATARAAEDASVTYIDASGTEQTVTAVVVDSATSSLGTGWYVVNASGVTRSGTITVSGSANLILADGASLVVTASTYNAGINVAQGNTLTIFGQSLGTGTLNDTGNRYGSGLGGGDGQSCGTVNVYGGNVTATGGDGGAGIGGGRVGGGGTVNIYGGTVTATSSKNGAGIGGGYFGGGGTVNVSGGSVTATGGLYGGAGIGGGLAGAGGNVTISGGTVTATGGDYGGAGIGGGDIGGGGVVVISGGSIWARGNDGAAAIGPGKDGSGGTLKNSDGDNVYLTTVTVKDGGGAAVASSNISLLSWGAGSAYYAYGVNDVKTDASGMLYLYLPPGTAAMAVKTPAPLKYSGSVTANTSSGVLTPDTQPPVVTSVEPGGQYAPLDGSIVITFDEEAIDGAGMVSVSSGGEYTALSGGTWSAGNTVYTLPYTGLPNRTHYTVKVEGFKDANNNTMASADNSHTFRTTPPVYTITYDLAGGTVSTPNPASFTDESADFTLVNPTRAGYTFSGWSGTGIASTDPSVTIPLGSTGNREYTAHWTANDYTLEFDLAGGAANNPVSYTLEGLPLTLENPSRAGYTFDGWSGTDIDGTALNLTIPANSIGNREYTAHWTANDYTLEFDAQGGTVSSASITVTYDAAVGELPTPGRTGYTFGGWYTGTGGAGTKYTADTVYQTAGDLTLHACWTLNTYALAYDLAGGTADNPASYTVEDPALTLANPSRAGYTFAGWSGTDIVGTTLGVTIPANSIGNREYTAHWTLITYGIRYDLDGGTLDKPNPDSYTVESAAITLNNPEKEGYTFVGWAGTGVSGRMKRVTIPAGSWGNRTYTAHWEQNPVYIAKTLIDDSSGISVSGNNIREDAVLTVTELNLGDSEACDMIRQRIDDSDYVFLLGKNISLTGGFTGMISISLPVGTQYDGKTVTVLHCKNGKLENYTVIVKDGMATFQVTSLSPFAVFAKATDTQTDSTETVPPSPSPSPIPNPTAADTAVSANADDNVDHGSGIGFIWWLLGGLVLVGVVWLVVFISHRRS